MKHYVRLDVSMKETFICVVDETGKIIYERRVQTDPELIAEQLKKSQVKVEKAGIESGSLSHWLVEELRRMGIPAICIDARKMAAVLSVQINKTDKNDARGIAEAMRCNLYREVMQKTKNAMELGTLLGSRRLLVIQKVQMTNAVRGFLKTYGLRLGSCGDKGFSKRVKELLSDKIGCARKGIEGLLHCFEKICEELKRLTIEIEQLAKEDKEVKKLITIPGVGIVTAFSYAV